MITLYAFGPAFGLPDPSPFVMKTEVQLKMSGLPYRTEQRSPPGAPKRKFPYIEDRGLVIADSTFIRDHIEKTYKVDFDCALTSEQRAQSWMIERVLEDHLYTWGRSAMLARSPAS